MVCGNAMAACGRAAAVCGCAVAVAAGLAVGRTAGGAVEGTRDRLAGVRLKDGRQDR